MKKYRDNGAVGALLDEYEKAILDLKKVMETISDQELIIIADFETEDPDCRSIQTILSHVIQSGYAYVFYIRKHLGEEIEKQEKESLNDIKTYIRALDQMFEYNEKLFDDYPDLELETQDPEKKIIVGWGNRYDVEQLFEHAIVHILRHRRQIERFLIKIRT